MELEEIQKNEQTTNSDFTDQNKNVKRKIKKIRVIAILSVLILITILWYCRFIATTGLVIKEYKVTNSKLPSSFYGFKIVHISDIHYGRTVTKKELDKLAEEINLLKPDIVVFTGDLFDNKVIISSEDCKDIIESLSKIKAEIGKYAIMGEDDYDNQNWNNIITNSGFKDLNNTYELIYKEGYEPILLAGLSSNLSDTKNAKDKIKPINDYIDSLKESEEINIPHYKILLMHEPDYITDITYQNYDLILAGHSHNGQVRLPFIGALLKPEKAQEYYDEYYKLDNTDFYISSGMGTTRLDFRLFNRPAINFYRLVNK